MGSGIGLLAAGSRIFGRKPRMGAKVRSVGGAGTCADQRLSRAILPVIETLETRQLLSAVTDDYHLAGLDPSLNAAGSAPL